MYRIGEGILLVWIGSVLEEWDGNVMKTHAYMKFSIKSMEGKITVYKC